MQVAIIIYCIIAILFCLSTSTLNGFSSLKPKKPNTNLWPFFIGNFLLQSNTLERVHKSEVIVYDFNLGFGTKYNLELFGFGLQNEINLA